MSAEPPTIDQAQLTGIICERPYQGGHFGRSPKKVTIHKNTQFKEEELLGALDSFKDGQ